MQVGESTDQVHSHPGPLQVRKGGRLGDSGNRDIYIEQRTQLCILSLPLQTEFLAQWFVRPRRSARHLLCEGGSLDFNGNFYCTFWILLFQAFACRV